MNISVLLSIEAIENLVNQTYDRVLYDGKAQNPEGDITHVTVWKNDRIRIFTENQSLIAFAPVHIKVNIRRNAPGIFDLLRDFSNLEKTDFDISVRLKTKVEVLPGWQLQTHSSTEFEWDKKPAAGPLNLLPISEFVKPHLEKELQTLARSIDHYICRELNFPRIIENAWKEITQPISLSLPVPTQVQLDLVNKNILLGPIIFSGKWITFPLAATFSANLQPQFSDSDSPPLPELKIADQPVRKTDFPFESKIAAEILNQLLDKQQVEVWQGRKVQILQPELFVFEGKIGLNARFIFAGSGVRWRGSFSILAQPFFDTEKEQISISDVQFDPAKFPRLIRGFSKFFRKKAEKQLLSALQKYSFEQMEVLRETISATVSHLYLAPGIELKGELQKLIIQEINKESEYLAVRGNVSGDIQVYITRL